jgi:uncharacterized coiled-coil DUF342 family protein
MKHDEEITVKAIGGRLINGKHYGDGEEITLPRDEAIRFKNQGLVSFDAIDEVDETFSTFQDTNLELVDKIQKLEEELEDASTTLAEYQRQIELLEAENKDLKEKLEKHKSKNTPNSQKAPSTDGGNA